MSNYALVWRGGEDGMQPVVDCVKLSEADFNAVTAIIQTVQEQPPPAPVSSFKFIVSSSGGVTLRTDHVPGVGAIRLLKYGETLVCDQLWIPCTSQGAWAHVAADADGATGWAAIFYNGTWYLRSA